MDSGDLKRMPHAELEGTEDAHPRVIASRLSIKKGLGRELNPGPPP
jgi:hypothetical protein